MKKKWCVRWEIKASGRDRNGRSEDAYLFYLTIPVLHRSRDSWDQTDSHLLYVKLLLVNTSTERSPRSDPSAVVVKLLMPA